MIAEFTIDELARETGMTVRSLRVYHERGVLPPPHLRGRTGFYSQDHLNRVRTISRLLDRGIKINGIRELLEAWDRGDDLGDLLGVIEPAAATERPNGAAAARPTGPRKRIPATDLADRYRGVPNGLARAVAAGLYEPADATTYRVRDHQLVGIAEQLAAAGLPPAQILDELDRVRADCDRIARRFADIFERTAVKTFHTSEGTAHDVAELSTRLADTRAVAGRVAAELVDQFVARYLDEVAREFGDVPPGRA